MATGVVYYWNGLSGWIKLDDVAELCTCQARDVMLLAGDATGAVAQGAAVNFTADPDEPWLAREATVT